MKNRKPFIIAGAIAFVVIVLLSSMLIKKANDHSNLEYVDGLTNETVSGIAKDNDRMYRRLELMKMQDEKTVARIYAQFFRVKKMNEDLKKYITKLRGELIARSEGIKPQVGDTLRFALIKNPDDVSSVNNLMLGSGTNGAAIQLKAKFIQLEEEINQLPAYAEQGRKAHVLCEECLQMRTGSKESWEEITFRDRKLIEALLTLDAICLKLTMLENEAVHSYIDEVK